MKAQIRLICLFLAFMMAIQTMANNGDPIYGERCPDFILSGINNWKQSTASLKDFKGKWLIIDVWSVGCVSCPAGFPVMNDAYNQLKDKATFITLGQEHRLARAWYEKYRVKYNLSVPYAFDSLFFETFGI